MPEVNAQNDRRDRRMEEAQRRRRALELRVAGATYEEIAEALGYSSRSAAWKAVWRAYRQGLRDPAEHLRELESERLDRLQKAWWGKALSGDVGAFRYLLRLMERRAKLLGLDAPTKIAPTDPSGEQEYAELSDVERLERIEAILERARTRRDRQAVGAGPGDQPGGHAALDGE